MKIAAEVCPVCGGTGWKFARPESARPEIAGSEFAASEFTEKDRRVVRCDCRLKARAESLLGSARIPKRYEHCELSNYEFDGPHRHLATARMAACKFVEEYPLDSTGLLLIGSIGVGKTHLAVGIIKELI